MIDSYSVDELLDLKIRDAIKKRWNYNHKDCMDPDFLEMEVERVKFAVTKEILENIIDSCIGRGWIDNY